MSNQEFRADWAERFGNPSPKIVCVGLNYSDHTEESGFEAPSAPLLFGKFASTLCGDGDPIVLPLGGSHVDAEAELAVVIGKVASRIGADDAYSHIAGYACANDVSDRDIQFSEGQWFRGKGFDTFCPVGPRVVPAGELDPSDLSIQQRLNGEVLQASRTSLLIFDIPYLVSYISQAITLEPGDLILTGTPVGVGVFRDPKIALKQGDVVEIEIEGIGILRNEVHGRA